MCVDTDGNGESCVFTATTRLYATATEYTGYEKYVGDLRVAMATAADARAGGLGDARGACAAAMARRGRVAGSR